MGKVSSAASRALYTDAQVIDATGMPVDSLRRLITWGAVQPEQSGGGRGRVRLWTTLQALRICVTSELAAAGYSLQMAHTIAYCLPIGNLMLWFDPDMHALLARAAATDETAKSLLKMLTQKRQPRIWPGTGEFARSQVLILEHRFVYCGSSQDDFELVAELDSERQRVIPFHDPVREVDGDRETDDSPRINGASLLIDQRLLEQWTTREPKAGEANFRARKLDMFMCKSLLCLNLSLSFLLCVRRLKGLPTRFTPGSIADEAEE